MQAGKHHFDHLKLFVPRTENAEREAQLLAERARELNEKSKQARRQQKEGDAGAETDNSN
ncbi:hypothetical protein N7486_006496 [Penicillium sp. IBT 16267x]|nr:hypothetical protein N7486_006496 [Penicillium sp. IBT 16267x]